MRIKNLDYIQEGILWLLIWGITFSNAIVEIGVGSLIVIFVFRKLVCKEAFNTRTPYLFIIGVFTAIVFVSFVRSPYHKESFRGFVKILKYVLLYVSVFDFLGGRAHSQKRLFWVCMYTAAFTFLNGIFQDLFGFDFMRHRLVDKLDYLHRISAGFVHSNDFGSYIIFCLPLALSFLDPKMARRKRVFLLIVFILGFYCLLRTSSRGAWLGSAVSLTMFFAVYKRKIAVLIPVVLLAVILIAPHGVDRIGGFFSQQKDSVWERVQLWKGTWNMVKEHPVLGFGINTFTKYFPVYKPQEYADLRYAHNSYLQMWSEIGLVGLSVFLFFLFSALTLMFRRITVKVKTGCNGLVLLGLSCGYSGFLVQAAFDTNFYSLVLVTLFWTMNAYSAALNATTENELHG